MALRLSPLSSRTSIFHLPANLRVALHQKALYTRPFSVTAPRKNGDANLISAKAIASSFSGLAEETTNSTLESITAIPLGLLDTLHSAGLPWWAVLPTSAVLVRTVFVYYFITKKSREHAQIQNNLVPLVSARALLMSRTPEVRKRIRGWPPRVRGIASMFERFVCTEQSAMAIGEQFSAPRAYLSWRPWANFGVLMAMMEAIRMKCGARTGFLSLLTTPLQWLWQNVLNPNLTMRSGADSESNDAATRGADDPDPASTIVDSPTSSNPEGYSCEVIAAARESTADPAVLNALSKLDGPSPMPQIVPTHAQYMDPTLHTEGFLWISDLAAADTTHYLPGIAACLLCLQIAIPPYRKQIKPPPMDEFRPRPVAVAVQLAPDAQLSFQSFPKSQQEHILEELGADPMWRKRVEEMPASLQKSALAVMKPKNSLPTHVSFVRAFRTRAAVAIAYLFFEFIAVNMPAGMLLYLMTSFSAGWLQARWLDYRAPIAPAILPCRRSLRFKVRGDMAFTLR